MAVYSVEGKLGTGKTKFAVWRAQAALIEGRRIASNVDLQCHKLAPRAKADYVRLPDKPTAFDLEAMGHGNPDSYDEERNGLLILDELATWFNARNFQDKGRADLIDWFVHARKHGWDVYLLVQNSNMIDKQLRDALIEYQVRCLRGDKMRIPLVGGMLNSLRKGWGYLPKFHLATARIGYGAAPIIAERWMYRGYDLHDAYDTRQVFRSDYPHGAHSVLPPWDFVPPEGWMTTFRRWLARRSDRRRTAPVLKPKPATMAGVMTMAPDQRVAIARRMIAANIL